MKEEEVFSTLREAGCCSGCCARFLGLRIPASYARIDQLAAKYAKSSTSVPENGPANTDMSGNAAETSEHVKDNNDHLNVEAQAFNGSEGINGKADNGRISSGNGPDHSGDGPDSLANGQDAAGNGAADCGPAAKKRKLDVCVCCLGILQKELWDETVTQVKVTLDKRGYDAKTFACALSSPACISLREKSLTYHLQSKFPEFSQQSITPLKEAWKWCFGPVLERAIGKALDSGAVCPLLITVNMEYEDDLAELDTLKSMAPAYYEQRARQSRRFPIDTTRRCVDAVLAGEASAEAVRRCYAVPPPPVAAPARALSVRCCHAPVYLGGRYIKLSRQLSQTPWLVDGKRMMETSVQDLIFKPIAEFYGIAAEDAERRLKFMSAGREDVDVRCLGSGRPFAVEIADPHRSAPGGEQLRRVAEQICASGALRVDTLRVVTKDDLTLLKKGEESKTKTYRALCIKLPRGVHDQDAESETAPTVVTDEDLERIRLYGAGEKDGGVTLRQKTPLRVLHRRPLHTRERRVLSMRGERVPGHPNLLAVSLETEAGTYVKEFVHGDLGRTRPCLRDVLGAHVDILALDVTAVHLDWPPPAAEL